MAFEAKVSGLKQIDHVVASANGAGLIVVQGELNDPVHGRLYVDKTQAVNQSLEQSTTQLQQEAQRQPQQQSEQQEPKRAITA